jgi:hypothetical protein
MALKWRSDLERVCEKLRHDGDADCWLWIGPLDADGYAAQMKVGSRTDGSRSAVRPHRWMYEHFIGPIPTGLVIDHLCRQRNCLNPLHMEAVTTEENTARGARATMTHCHRGHVFAGLNLRISASGGRVCKTCFREYQARYQKANGRKHQTAYRARRKEMRKSATETF